MSWWPPSAALGLAALIAALVVAVALRGAPARAGRRAWVLAALRGASVLVLVGALGLPHSPALSPPPALPAVTLVLDTSRSMSLPGTKADRTRLSEAVEAARALTGKLRDRGATELRLMALDEGTRPITDLTALEAKGAATDLAAGIEGLAAAGIRGEVVLFTDGRDITGARGSELGALAAGHGMRLHGVAAEGSGSVRDVAVDGLSGPRRVRAGSAVTLTAQVRVSGVEASELSAELLRDGARVGTPKVPRDGGAVAIRTRAGEVGRRRFALRVPPMAGELTAANNAAAVVVEVIPDKPRVVLVASAPSPEYARLKALLLGDPGLRVSCYVAKGAGGQVWRDDTRLEAVSGLGGLDEAEAVIALGPPPGLDAGLAGKLAARVRSGGGLLVAPGVDGGAWWSGALAQALPLRPAGARSAGLPLVLAGGAGALTQGLRQAGVRAAELPAPRSVLRLRPAAGAEVALTSGGAPVLAGWAVQRGRAAALATDETHRWLLSAQADEGSRRGYERFWGALVGWLTAPVPTHPVTAELDRDTYEEGATARLVVSVSDGQGHPAEGATVEARWSRAGLTEAPVRCGPAPGTPGSYQALVALRRPGEVKVEVSARLGGRLLGKAEATAQVLEATLELRRPEPDPALLEAVCVASGGGLLRGARVEALLPGGGAATPPARNWWAAPGPWALALVVALWGADWWLRRRWWG